MRNQINPPVQMILQSEYLKTHESVVKVHESDMKWTEWCIKRGYAPNTINEWQIRKGIRYLVSYVCGYPAETPLVVIK